MKLKFDKTEDGNIVAMILKGKEHENFSYIFYDRHPVKYYDARYYYYKNRGILKEWRPF